MIRLVLVIAAAVCFAVAVLVSATTLGGNFDAWLAGGLLAWALSVLVAALEAAKPAPGAPPAG